MLRQPALWGAGRGSVNVTWLREVVTLQASKPISGYCQYEQRSTSWEGGQGASGGAKCKVQKRSRCKWGTEVNVEGITEVKVQTHRFNKVSCVPYVHIGALDEER